MRTKSMIGFALLIMLVGCTQVRYFELNTPPPGKQPAESIEVLTTEPDRDQIVLGIIEVESDDIISNKEMMAALKKKAMKVGADAIIFTDFGTKTEQQSSYSHVTKSQKTTSVKKKIVKATAIAWK